METNSILLSIAIVLLGLKMFDLNKNNFEEFGADRPGECAWCNSPYLKIFYGLLQLVAVVYTLGMTIYLCFSESWWYMLAYVIAVPIAIILSKLIKMIVKPLSTFVPKHNKYPTVYVYRMFGIVFVLIGFSICLLTL